MAKPQKASPASPELAQEKRSRSVSFWQKRDRDFAALATESINMAEYTSQKLPHDSHKLSPDVSPQLSGRFPIARWAPIPLRLIVGYGFMAHGFAKLSKGPDTFATILHGIGIPWAHFMAWSTILIELLGGLAVILGAFVVLVSIPMSAVLLVAMFTVHLPYGFSSIKLLAVTAAGASSDRPAMKRTSCISPASRPSFWGAPGHWQLMA